MNSLSDPPNNTSVSYSGPVQEGSSATLTCEADSNPAVDSYTWYKVAGDQVTEVGSEKMLSTAVSEVDSQFFCHVSNRYGAQNSSIARIDVLCKFSKTTEITNTGQQRGLTPNLWFACPVPPKDTAVVVDPDGPILEGGSVALLCRGRANPPVTNYTWYKDDKEDGEAGQTLVLTSVDPSHGGEYLCRAGNELGENVSRAFQLDIQCESIPTQQRH